VRHKTPGQTGCARISGEVLVAFWGVTCSIRALQFNLSRNNPIGLRNPTSKAHSPRERQRGEPRPTRPRPPRTPRPLPQGANPSPSRPHPPDTGAAPRTNVAVAYAAAFVTSGNSDSQTSSVGRGRAPPLIRHHRHARPRSLSEPDDAIAQHGRYRPYVRRCDRSAAEYPAVRTPRPGRSAGAGGPSEQSQQLLRYGR